MALTKKSWQDHFLAAFGQAHEPARSRTTNDVLLIGGIYEGTVNGTLSHGDVGILHTDSEHNLMVNLAGTEPVIVQIGTINTGTIASITNVANVASGTLATLGTVGVINAGSVVMTAGTVSTLNTVGTVGVLNAGSVVMTAGTVSTLNTVGTVGVLNAGSVVMTAGTVSTLNTVGTVGVLNDGSVVVTGGTVKGAGATGAAAVGYPVLVAGADGGGTVYTLAVDTSGHQQIDVQAGSIVMTAGTVSTLNTVGTVGVVNAGSIVVTVGTTVSSVTAGTQQTLGTVGVLNAGSVVMTAGTVSTLNTVGTVGVLNAGSVVMTAGTVSTLNTVGTVGVVNAGSVVVTNGSVTLNTLISGEDQTNNVMKVEGQFLYHHFTAAATTNIKNGAGLLHAVVVNTKGTSPLTIYDATGTVATSIGIIAANCAEQTLLYDVKFGTALTVAATSAWDVTVAYR